MSDPISPTELSVQLQNEFTRRRQRNERYSLRAFARQLEMDPSTVSQILSGKRIPSPDLAGKIASKAGFSRPDQSPYSLVTEDAFLAIADWYHYAILDLTLLKNFRSEDAWIAARLGLSVPEARAAVDRLLRLGLLKRVRGRLRKAEYRYSNYVEGQTSAAHREYQRQIIQKALDAVDSCPQHRKDITSITIAADSRRLMEAKRRIKKFRRELCDFLEGGSGDSVMQLAVQLFPLTTDFNEKKANN